jgi:hypothetical protein
MFVQFLPSLEQACNLGCDNNDVVRMCKAETKMASAAFKRAVFVKGSID